MRGARSIFAALASAAMGTKPIGRPVNRKPVNLGNNARKRAIPSKRKTRVRLRAHLEGRLTGRPLTAHERSWL